MGKNKLIPMNELKELFIDMKMKNPKTYLRSGNVVFEYSDLNINEIANKISKGIKDKFDFDVEVIVKTKEDISNIIENNPYEDDNPIEELYVSIFKENISKNLFSKLIKEYENISTEDEFSIAEIAENNKEIYLLCKSKYHKTKFNNNYFESKLDNIATTRNWKTLCKIKDMF